MRIRITAHDVATGLTSDLMVECSADDKVAELLYLVRQEFATNGYPVVGGTALNPDARIGDSPLRQGSVLMFTTTGGEVDRTVPIRRPVEFHLRVLSGPAAGSVLALVPGVPVRLGRAAEADLVLDDPDVSRRHAEIATDGSQVLLTDTGSANGVWIGGRRITDATALEAGQTVQIGGSRLVVERRDSGAAVTVPDPAGGGYLVNRHQRRLPVWRPAAVGLPEPPVVEPRRPFPWLVVLAPAVIAGALALLLRQPIFLVFAALSPMTAAVSQWSERRRQRRAIAANGRRYELEVEAVRVELQGAVDSEDEYLRLLWPDADTVVRIATTPRVELWQRRPEHVDWSQLRLGTADRPAAATVGGPRPDRWVDPLVPAAPVGLRLDDCPVIGLAGPLEATMDSLRWVVLQAAVLHSPTDLKIVVVAPGAREEDLGWTRWLPHARDDDGNVLAAWSGDDVDEIVRFLGAVVDARAGAPQWVAPGQRPLPRILVVLAGAATLSDKPMLAQLLADGPAAGLAFVCMEPDPSRLPGGCGAVLVHAPATERPGPPVDRRASPLDPTGSAILTVAGSAAVTVRPDGLGPDTAQVVARALAPLRTVGANAVTRLPDRLRYVELAGEPTPGQVAAAWRLRPYGTEVPIGVDADGPVTVDLVRDGPHALVVGSRGAGRTELLRTMLAGLAVRNTPDHLNFLFVDQKGATTFQDLRRLPHVVATVTNLDHRLAARALASLRAELQRRQRQLADAEAADIAEYLRARAADPGLAPFPRLAIVIDDFAELGHQLPDLLEDLVGVVRTGRSVGVHLLLATHQAGGALTAQLRDNVGLRVCLRVDEEAESTAVIGLPDAAGIPPENPGRGYLCTGAQPPRLMQTAQVSTPRSGTGTTRRVVALHWHDRVLPEPSPAPENASTDLTRLLEVVTSAARAERLGAPRQIISPPLPEIVTLDDLPAAADPAHRHRLLLGLRDVPALQRHEALTVELGSGHLAVIGSARSGRTSTVRAVAAGLARQCPPQEVHLHVLDGTGALTGLAALPHCGVRCWPEDGERVDRLLARLTELIAERRRLLAAAGARTVAQLWERDPAQAPPHVVLLVDGWEAFGAANGGARQDQLADLLAHGLPAGITVCLAGDETLLSSRLLSRVSHRLLLRLDNPADAALAGLPPRAMPAHLPPGRALWAPDGTEVQIPLLVADPSPAAQTGALAAVVDQLRGARPARTGDPRAPMRLDPLPRRITVEEADRLGAPPGPGPYALLGVTGDVLSPLWVDLREHRSIVVAGPARSGRSTAAVAIAVSLSRQGCRVLLLAMAGPGPVHDRAAEHGVTVVTGAAVTRALATSTFDAVVIDDADQAPADDPVLAAATSVGGAALVVTAALESFGSPVRGPLSRWRRDAGAVVLLSPPDRFSASNVGVQISAAMAFAGPPGRAYLVVRGVPVLGQVASVAPAAHG